MTTVFRQAIVRLAIPVALIAVVALVTPHSHTGHVFCAGLLVSALALAGMWGYSWLFEVRHPTQPPDFWRRQEAKMRPRIFAGFSSGLVAGAGIIALSLAGGRPVVAAALLAPTFVCFSVVVLMWGKVP
jgi:hypothetical protein